MDNLVSPLGGATEGNHAGGSLETPMLDPDPPDLFSTAGIPLEAEPTQTPPKRQRKARKPTPAELAAADRLMGGRRLRAPQAPGRRTRVGQPRDLSPAPVLAFPLSRNAGVLSATVERLPHFYDDAFEKKWSKVGRNVEDRLVRRGLAPEEALNCAHELLDAALNIRATQAENERKRG